MERQVFSPGWAVQQPGADQRPSLVEMGEELRLAQELAHEATLAKWNAEAEAQNLRDVTAKLEQEAEEEERQLNEAAARALKSREKMEQRTEELREAQERADAAARSDSSRQKRAAALQEELRHAELVESEQLRPAEEDGTLLPGFPVAAPDRPGGAEHTALSAPQPASQAGAHRHMNTHQSLMNCRCTWGLLHSRN